MDNAKLVMLIAKWIKENAESESAFLTPCPAWTVDAHRLLDYISLVSGVSKERISGWVNE